MAAATFLRTRLRTRWIERILGPVLALRQVATAPGLRRVLGGYALFACAENATWLAVTVFAFARGGAGEAGIVAVVQLLPATVVAPWASHRLSRVRADRALAVGFAAQATACSVTAVAMAAAPVSVAYAAAVGAAVAFTLTRPVVSAVTPLLVRTPAQLVSANVVTTAIDRLGQVIGPAAAGVLLMTGSPAAVFAMAAVATGAALAFSLRLGESVASSAVVEHDASTDDTRRGAVRRAMRADRELVWVFAVLGVGGFCTGAMDILAVLYAETSLSRGESTAGMLAAGFGVGSVVGALSASPLARGSRTSPFLVGAGACAAAGLAVLGVVSSFGGGLVLFAAAGLGTALMSVIGLVCLQRVVPQRSVGLMFGMVESAHLGSLALGSLVVAWLAESAGLPAALISTGIGVALVIACAGVVLGRAGTLRSTAAPETFARVADDELLAPLPVPALERLAVAAVERFADRGEVIVRQGDVGDDYFLIVDGSVDVDIDGQFVRTRSAGESFGELALLFDVPRTASITATEPTRLLTIEREVFLEAVTSLDASRIRAHTTVARYIDAPT